MSSAVQKAAAATAAKPLSVDSSLVSPVPKNPKRKGWMDPVRRAKQTEPNRLTGSSSSGRADMRALRAIPQRHRQRELLPAKTKPTARLAGRQTGGQTGRRTGQTRPDQTGQWKQVTRALSRFAAALCTVQARTHALTYLN